MSAVGRRARLPIAALVAVAAAWPLAEAVRAGPDEPVVPARIAVGDSHKLYLVAHAVGVQVHRCDAIGGGYAWSFVGPRATLYDDRGMVVGTHYGGPTWEARDGSTVVGSRVDGVTVDPSAIPWLLLSAARTTIGPDGGRLAATTYIQRIATTGGLTPPAADCGAARVGDVVEVPCTADYTFWKAK